MILRLDDICLNTDMSHANALAEMWTEHWHSEVWYCVSPLIFVRNDERVFPPILKALSDYRKFYEIDACGIPDVPDSVTVCSHGLIHVDHRLLDRSAQEMSILASCHLLKSRVFVPPFNKWTSDMLDICRENGIHLVCFEDGWRSVECEPYTESIDKYYLHSRNVTHKQMESWLKASV
jgi:hypothetical protein